MGAKGSSSVRINIYVDDSAIRKEVKLAAALRDISVSEYCLAAIREKLAREKSTGGTARQPQSLEKAVESARKFHSKTFRGRAFSISSAELIRDARKGRSRNGR